MVRFLLTLSQSSIGEIFFFLFFFYFYPNWICVFLISLNNFFPSFPKILSFSIIIMVKCGWMFGEKTFTPHLCDVSYFMLQFSWLFILKISLMWLFSVSCLLLIFASPHTNRWWKFHIIAIFYSETFMSEFIKWDKKYQIRSI